MLEFIHSYFSQGSRLWRSGGDLINLQAGSLETRSVCHIADVYSIQVHQLHLYNVMFAFFIWFESSLSYDGFFLFSSGQARVFESSFNMGSRYFCVSGGIPCQRALLSLFQNAQKFGSDLLGCCHNNWPLLATYKTTAADHIS